MLYVLRGLVVAGLLVSGAIHADLAPNYALIKTSTLSEQDLFYAQAVVAALVALWLLLRGSRLAWTAALVVGAGSLAAVLTYRYVDVHAIGIIPSMYEPYWFTRKIITAYAEGAVTALSVVALSLTIRRGAPQRH